RAAPPRPHEGPPARRPRARARLSRRRRDGAPVGPPPHGARPGSYVTGMTSPSGSPTPGTPGSRRSEAMPAEYPARILGSTSELATPDVGACELAFSRPRVRRPSAGHQPPNPGLMAPALPAAGGPAP